jgi:hypothetical protein
VVTLAAAAVVQDLVAAVARPQVDEPGGDLADGGVPVDRLEASVGSPAQRRVEAVARRLVEVEALRLLAEVAARDRVVAVALDLDQVAAARPPT